MELPQLERGSLRGLNTRVQLFTGRANPQLAQEIADYLGTELSPVLIKNFADGEIYVQIQESIRGHDVFLIQSTCKPVNENLMEMLLVVDALRRASARTINIVMPYFGYARQDRKTQGREAISAKLVADLISNTGADRIIAMDLHTGQLQGFFNIKVDHLYSTPVLVDYLRSKNLKDIVIVSPDAGGVERARVFAKKFKAPIAIIDKRRAGHNSADVYNLIGDVKGKQAVIVDDMIDTGGTICAGAQMLKDQGATEVYACAAHPVFSGPAVERLAESIFDEVIVTNSIPLSADALKVGKIKQLSVAPILGEAIGRINHDLSVSEMFE
ncbi:MAG: ribose-phosphate pyrophosphokinase [Cyanobacteria bacterium HKST-UBA06]|nr:ribose-phosphate pyrophosphokinase [Cyanobacteria bacterium HKST-UBA06]